MSDAPRILVFTGDGKGKTTAALGMVLRAVGHGFRVAIVQFIKHDLTVGELRGLEKLPGVTCCQTGRGFVPQAGSPQFPEHRAAAEAGLAKAREFIAAGEYDLVVLDEICNAIGKGLLSEESVLDTLALAKPSQTLVLTGRGATPALIDLADTVTEMRCVKHALAAGRPAQAGVER